VSFFSKKKPSFFVSNVYIILSLIVVDIFFLTLMFKVFHLTFNIFVFGFSLSFVGGVYFFNFYFYLSIFCLVSFLVLVVEFMLNPP